MSYVSHYKDIIEDGDTIILYINPERMSALVVKSGKNYQSHKGVFDFDDLIGKPFGKRWYNRSTTQWITVLHPTPELWTQVLSHRTQIIYTPDASFIISALGLRPGSIVVESGTGSGSLSHHFLRTIVPCGHLYTFEYHEARAKEAKREFELHKLSEFVTVNHQDVCQNGFGLVDIADAVFLDLPNPWEVIKFAKGALKKNSVSRICTFSPCIEQIQKTVQELIRNEFEDLEMVEILTKEHFIKQMKVIQPSLHPNDISNSSTDIIISKSPDEMKGHTSYLLFGNLYPKIDC